MPRRTGRALSPGSEQAVCASLDSASTVGERADPRSPQAMDVIQVPLWGWAATVAGLFLLVVADLVLGSRQQRAPGLREACLGTIAVVALAVLFGTGLAWTEHPAAASQFFAGWLSEFSLSLDNLFIFDFLVGRSAVPRDLPTWVRLPLSLLKHHRP